MKRIYRIKKNWEFQDIINSKQQIVTKNLILYFRKGSNFQIGISIPKKFCNAVERNFQKRQIKAILREISIKEIKFQTVLIIRKNFLSLSFLEKKENIKKIYERIKGEPEKP